MNILVVEDNQDTRELLVLHLTLQGHEVSGAEDGQEGLDRIKEDRPDLILTDLSMPRLNGVELIRRVRGDSGLAGMKIIAITAHGSGDANEARRAGADIVLHKPTPLDSLADIVKQMTK
ncbi:MAG TPA: response regulator [Blastocatellia bacterium]|nr:response regulator [Blastocatellia bacterium]